MLTLGNRHKPLPLTTLIVAVSLGMGIAPSAQPLQGGGRPEEGIKVHGHWAIDVRNPDGTLVSHTEFNNKLNANGPSSGADFLAKVLLQQVLFGNWAIRLTGTTAPPCPGGTAGGFATTDCWILQATAPPAQTGTAVFRNLTSVLGTTGEIVLSGNATVGGQAPAVINQVATHVSACASGIMGNSCGSLGSLGGNDPTTGRTAWLFTEHDLGGADPTVTVQPGQIVQVTVRIKFQ